MPPHNLKNMVNEFRLYPLNDGIGMGPIFEGIEQQSRRGNDHVLLNENEIRIIPDKPPRLENGKLKINIDIHDILHLEGEISLPREMLREAAIIYYNRMKRFQTNLYNLEGLADES